MTPFLAGPWRSVPVLALTQIIAWGTLFFPVVLLVPAAAAGRGWSPSVAMAGFSAALLVSGLCSPRVGRLVDRFGGHVVMPCGSAIGAAGLAGLAFATSVPAWIACWCVTGIGMAATLYDVAFASLARIFGTTARKPIAWLALLTGFASTISWPATHALHQSVGWERTWLLYAAVLVFVNAPLAFLALPRSTFAESPGEGSPARTGNRAYLPPHGTAFLLAASAFAAYGFYHGGHSAHTIALFSRLGVDAGTVVALASICGPAQVATRLVEIVFGRGRLHPLWMARGAVALVVVAFAQFALFGVSALTVGVFFVLYGIANGVFTLVRGALPLALFGPDGYGHVMGRIALPSLVLQAAAPLALAFVVERISDAAALVFLAAVLVVSLVCFSLLRRPAAE